MIQHFHFKPLFKNSQLPGWEVTFYYKQQRFLAEYKKDGKISWIGLKPIDKEILAVEKMIHELMLYHVYN